MLLSSLALNVALLEHHNPILTLAVADKFLLVGASTQSLYDRPLIWDIVIDAWRGDVHALNHISQDLPHALLQAISLEGVAAPRHCHRRGLLNNPLRSRPLPIVVPVWRPRAHRISTSQWQMLTTQQIGSIAVSSWSYRCRHRLGFCAVAGLCAHQIITQTAHQTLCLYSTYTGRDR